MKDLDKDLIKEIEEIIKKELPTFWFQVRPYRSLGTTSLAICMAVTDYNINGVSGQKPQAVSLELIPDTFELSIQIYGGMGGSRIDRKPNKENPKEFYLAMKGEKVPFRTPQKNKEAVMKAITKFCQNYKAKLIEFKEVLMYQNYVDYSKHF